MSTYDATISLMKQLPENDLIKIKEYVSRLLTKPEERVETYNPYKPLTREEIIQRLDTARKHADEGKTMDAKLASANIRSKYGLQ